MNRVTILVLGPNPEIEKFFDENAFEIDRRVFRSIRFLQELLGRRRYDAILFGIETELNCHVVKCLRNSGIGMPIVKIELGSQDPDWSCRCARFLNAGGDDFLVGPAEPELVAESLKAVIRRTRVGASEIVRFHQGREVLEVDMTLQRIYVNGEIIERLTPTLERVFFAIASHKGPTPREYLWKLLNEEERPGRSTLGTYITRIKVSLGKGSVLLKNRWGFGYELVGRI